MKLIPKTITIQLEPHEVCILAAIYEYLLSDDPLGEAAHYLGMNINVVAKVFRDFKNLLDNHA